MTATLYWAHAPYSNQLKIGRTQSGVHFRLHQIGTKFDLATIGYITVKDGGHVAEDTLRYYCRHDLCLRRTTGLDWFDLGLYPTIYPMVSQFIRELAESGKLEEPWRR